MTAAQAYDAVTNGGARYFGEVVAVLNRHGLWCLIGGLAVNHYVEPVYTIDADVVVVSDNLAAIQEELIRQDFRVEAFAHTVNATRSDSQLSLQFTTEPRYQSFIERAGPGEILGCVVPVAALPDLIQGKIWAWSDPGGRLSKRKKDELDLIRIAESYQALRRLMPDEIVSQLEND